MPMSVLHLFHLDEVAHLGDGATRDRVVAQGVRLPDAAEPEGAQRAALLRLGGDRRPHLLHPDLGHQPASTAAAGSAAFGPRWLSRYALSRPFGTNSSAGMPRSRAISSGRRSAFSPAIVARATLMWLAEPSDLQRTSWMPASSRIARAAPPAI